MKRTCNDCRALYRVEFGIVECELGHKIKAKSNYKGIGVEYKPLEECPKPKTYDEYFKAKQKR